MGANGHVFGTRIRRLREGMDLSLRDLGERSGVSAPMLSQVERGETSPTLSVAERIATGLELSLSQLLRLDESDGVSVVRAADRRRGGAGRHRYEVLTPPQTKLRLPSISTAVSRLPGSCMGGSSSPAVCAPGFSACSDTSARWPGSDGVSTS